MLKKILCFITTVACLVSFESECRKIPIEKPFFKNLLNTLFRQELDNHIYKIALSDNGNKLAAISGRWRPQLYIWDLNSDQKEYTLELSTHTPTLVFSPDNNKIATRDKEGLVHIFDMKTGKLLTIINSGRNFFLKGLLVFSPCSNFIATNDGCDIKIFDINTTEKVHEFSHSGWISAFKFNKSGCLLASVAEGDNFVRVWDLKTGKVKSTLSGKCLPRQEFMSVAFSHDENYIAAGDYEKLYIWNLHTGVRVNVLEGHSCFITSLVFSPNDSKLASGSSDATIRIWDVVSSKELAIFHHPGIAEKMNDVFFSNQGDKLISLHGHRIHIWDIKTGEKILLGQQFKMFYSLRVENDILAAASGEDAVYVWDLNKLNTELLKCLDSSNKCNILIF